MNRVVITSCGILSHKVMLYCNISSASYQSLLVSNDTSNLHGDLPLKFNEIRKSDSVVVVSPLLNRKPSPAKVSGKRLLTQRKFLSKKKILINCLLCFLLCFV